MDESKKKHNIGALRFALIGFGIIVLGLFIAPIVANCSINIGTVTGILIGGLLVILGLFQSGISSGVEKVRSKKAGKIITNIVFILAGAIVITAVVETALMIGAAINKPKENATLIVLGCRVYGETPSRVLVGRLEAAYDYLLENESAICIVSGGKGDGENISEAECMYRYLVAKGIDPKRIFKEDKSVSTRENIKFSKEIIEENDLTPTIAIATSEFHEYRASIIAKGEGLKAYSVPGRTEWWLLPNNYMRELYGILYQWFGMRH